MLKKIFLALICAVLFPAVPMIADEAEGPVPNEKPAAPGEQVLCSMTISYSHPLAPTTNPAMCWLPIICRFATTRRPGTATRSSSSCTGRKSGV